MCIRDSPLIIRTRGHRLEGIWHSGSPMGMLLNGTRGMYLCVPRDMTRAAGFYNTLMQSNDPAMVIECLNGYRVKEKMPNNIGEFCVPLGKIEVTKRGDSISLVTYGSTWRVVMDAAQRLERLGIQSEVIDIQTLVPFDLSHEIVESVKKTNRIIIIDEDVPGGASAYILHKLIDKQEIFTYLDSPPKTFMCGSAVGFYGNRGTEVLDESSEAGDDFLAEI